LEWQCRWRRRYSFAAIDTHSFARIAHEAGTASGAEMQEGRAMRGLSGGVVFRAESPDNKELTWIAFVWSVGMN
jgi:hypothetical protein